MEAKTVKALESSRRLSGIVKGYYKNINERKAEGQTVIWSSGIASVELFHAMDVVPVFPENYAAACNVKQLGLPLIEQSESMGYSSDLCSYFRTDIGHISTGCNYLGGLPAPDAVIASRNLCTSHVKWFEILARYFGCPMFVLDQPTGVLNTELEPEAHRLEYSVRQFVELIEFLEKLTGKKRDMDRIQQAVALGDRSAEIWQEINQYRKIRPIPISSQDMLGNLFCLVVLSGTEESVDFLEMVLSEVKKRAADGIGVIPNEKYRILWDAMPLWYNLGFYSRLESYGAVTALEIYNIVFGHRVDPATPLESLAKRNLIHIFNMDAKTRFNIVKKYIEDYHIDGCINHVLRSCISLAVATTHLSNLLRDRLNMPVLTINCDHCDSRAFSAEQFETRLQAFFELLDERKISQCG